VKTKHLLSFSAILVAMKVTLHRGNQFLGVVVILLCTYILVAPALPSATFWWHKSVTKQIPELVAAVQDGRPPDVIPDKNTLVIPSMNLQQEVFESKNQSALNKGVWRFPNASTPAEGNNTVLIGHRFTYNGPAVFYHMDLVKKGDKIVMYWDKKKYEYTVEEVTVVPPSAKEIQQRDVGEERLTIYTCTPLMTARNRLVIIAKPDKDGP